MPAAPVVGPGRSISERKASKAKQRNTTTKQARRQYKETGILSAPVLSGLAARQSAETLPLPHLFRSRSVRFPPHWFRVCARATHRNGSAIASRQLAHSSTSQLSTTTFAPRRQGRGALNTREEDSTVRSTGRILENGFAVSLRGSPHNRQDDVEGGIRDAQLQYVGLPGFAPAVFFLPGGWCSGLELGAVELHADGLFVVV